MTATPKRINIVGPMLHHGAPFVEIFSVVISSTYGIALQVGELTLYHVGSETHFVERGRGHRSEAVNGRSTVISHAVQGIEHRVVAHASLPRGRREQKWARVRSSHCA